MPDFAHVKSPLMTPTCCIGCNTHANSKGFVDTLRELPGYGRVYLCAQCVLDAGRHVGLVDSDVHARLKTVCDELLSNVDVLEGRLAELQPVADALAKTASRKAAA